MSSNYQPPRGTPDYGQYNPNQPGSTEPYPGYAPPGQYGAQEQYPQAPYGQQPDTQMPSQSSRNTATFAHLSLLISALLSLGILVFVGPLVLYFIAKDNDPFARRAAAAAFNFAVGLAVGAFAAVVIAFTLILLPVAVVLGCVILILSVVCPILGAVRASKGQDYKYPFSLNILK